MNLIFTIILAVLTFNQLSADNFITVGTFNIEWLGDGIDDQKLRTEEEYTAIARVIKEMNLDILALQEIENQSALNHLMKYLNGYKSVVTNSGGKQNLALLYKSNIEVFDIQEYSPLEVIKDRTRPALIASIKKDNFDFRIMIVHLKSTSSHDDTPELKQKSFEIRKSQVNLISHWIDSCMVHSKEKDYIILGDFNDHIQKPNSQLKHLAQNKYLECVTKDLKSCLRNDWSTIDNIFISKNVSKRVMKGSLANEYFRSYIPKKFNNLISDHCPVYFKLISSLQDED